MSEQSSRFKLEAKMPLENEGTKKKKRVVARPSITSIPSVDLAMLLAQRKKSPEKSEIVVTQSESLCDVLCNSHKFAMNYFEQNFEWLPMEVISTGERSKVFQKFPFCTGI